MEYKTVLAHSRCFIPICSPSYFNLPRSLLEFATFLHRETLLGYGTQENRLRLIFPTVVSDGIGFPIYAQRIPQFNCREYMIPNAAFELTPKYIEFREKLISWVDEVSITIINAPAWKSDWIDVKITLPSNEPKPKFRLTSLG